MLVGGIAANFGGGYRLGGGREFVIEGDEYDSAFFDKTAKFLKYLPDIAIVNNIEFDHADIYADVEAVTLAFKRLAVLVPRNGLLLLGADSPRAAALAAQACSPVETFGLSGDPTWLATDVAGRPAPARAFKVRRHGTLVRRLRAAAARRSTTCATRSRRSPSATRSALDARAIAEGLRTFAGREAAARAARQRSDGVDACYDDFAHHPTAVAETIAALRLAHPDRRIWAIFEPRSASSCLKVFQRDFAEAFEGADEVVVAPVFRAKLAEDRRLSPAELVGRPAGARAVGARAARRPTTSCSTWPRGAHPAISIVVMSNGGFDGIHEKLLDALRARAS